MTKFGNALQLASTVLIHFLCILSFVQRGWYPDPRQLQEGLNELMHIEWLGSGWYTTQIPCPHYHHHNYTEKYENTFTPP